MWPDDRVLALFGIQLPIIQAPMAGSVTSEMVVAVSASGGLGSLPCSFCHKLARVDPAREVMWRRRLEAYFAELGLDSNAPFPIANRAPFHPEVVSFHFGLPDENLLAPVRGAGARIVSSATSVDEARWLEDQGCDAIVAKGYEAGGHWGIFLAEDVSTQVGTMALAPQVVDAVKVPVIAAGGIADARGVVAAFALGASAVQIGTAYLLCTEAKTSPAYRQALRSAKDNETALTNVFTGRPARGIVNRLVREIGPMSDVAPDFPLAAALAPLRPKSEMAGSADFSPLWAGQAARLSRELPAAELTKQLAAETLEDVQIASLQCRFWMTCDHVRLTRIRRLITICRRKRRGHTVGFMVEQ